MSTWLATKSIVSSERVLRDIVNSGGLPSDRIIDHCGDRWHTLCASLDLLGDTSLALIHAERQFKQLFPCNSDGQRYLAIYGTFQIIVMQQDAVGKISSALAVKNRIIKNDAYKKLRELRVRLTGHPLESKENGIKRVWGIIRNSLADPNRVQPYEWIPESVAPGLPPISMNQILKDHAAMMRKQLLLCAKQVKKIDK